MDAEKPEVAQVENASKLREDARLTIETTKSCEWSHGLVESEWSLTISLSLSCRNRMVKFSRVAKISRRMRSRS